MLTMTLATLVGTCGGVTLASYEQGAKFDKCIKTTDWESKSLADEIEVSDRGSDGCCPTGTVPGVQHRAKYVGAQVVCGFTSDGTVKFSTSGGSSTSCTYNQCYVWKQNLECSGGGKQFLNGCCAAPADCKTGACGFKDLCKNYAYSMSNVHSEKTEYCTTYHKNYAMKNTADKGDDQADNKLKVNDKLYYYTACAGSEGGTSVSVASPTPSGASPTPSGTGSSGSTTALQRLGTNPASLAVCQGDCDTDTECPGASKCIQRTAGSPAAVAGCTVGDSGSNVDTDYCSNPSTSTASWSPTPSGTAAVDDASVGARGVKGVGLVALLASIAFMV